MAWILPFKYLIFISCIDCEIICPMGIFPMCGSDGVTYSSTCGLKRQSCFNKKTGKDEISVKHTGPC